MRYVKWYTNKAADGEGVGALKNFEKSFKKVLTKAK